MQEIKTQRLLLRQVDISDSEQLLHIIWNDMDVIKYTHAKSAD